MSTFKQFLCFLFFVLFSTAALAQDAVIISDGNFVRGTIQGTDFSMVRLLQEDHTVVSYKAKDIKEFLWNGETYVSKPIVMKKKMEFRFFKVEERGAVNLYSMGETVAEGPPERRIQVRPSLGVGIGSGGYGGVGLGGGITFGSGRRNGNSKSGKSRQGVYYIEKLGTGPMQALPVEGNSASKAAQIKAILLQQLSNDEDLAERIKATESFDAKNIKAFVSAYNSMHP